jgi:hypothetical protein
LANKRNFLDVSGEIAETVDPIFFSDPQAAAAKAMGLRNNGFKARTEPLFQQSTNLQQCNKFSSVRF